jgi:hypothetical protein
MLIGEYISEKNSRPPTLVQTPQRELLIVPTILTPTLLCHSIALRAQAKKSHEFLCRCCRYLFAVRAGVGEFNRTTHNEILVI